MRRLLIIIILWLPSTTIAFGSRTHQEVTREAARFGLAKPDEPVLCAREADLRLFLRHLHHAMATATTPDAAAFLGRWPDASDFGLAEAKGFLDLTRHEGMAVAGLDFLPCDDGGTAIGILEVESVRPDVDGRNLYRKEPVGGTLGPFPEDPIVLDLGGLDGLASQAHAHYLLAEEPWGWFARGDVTRRLKSGPLDLLRDPAHFAVATAVPGGPVTLGADMAMEHFLLALLAASWPDPASRRLSLAFLGHALHYVQDAADPLHTVQVGHPCVVWHGAAAFAGRALWTAGGYAGPVQGPTSVISDVVSNLHLWSEAWWDAGGVVFGAGWWTRAWGEAVRAVPGDLAGALLAAWRAAEAGRTRGPALYGAACRAVSPEVLRYGSLLQDGKADATSMLGDEEAGREVMRIGLEAASVALAESLAMVRAYEVLVPRMAEPKTHRLVAALLASRMRAVQQREARLAAWKKGHPDGVAPRTDPVRIPAILFVEAAVIGVMTWVAWRGVRRVRSRAAIRAESTRRRPS